MSVSVSYSCYNTVQSVICNSRYLTLVTTTLPILLYASIGIVLLLQQRCPSCYMQVSVSYSCYNNAAHHVVCRCRYLTHVTTLMLILLYVGIGILLMRKISTQLSNHHLTFQQYCDLSSAKHRLRFVF